MRMRIRVQVKLRIRIRVRIKVRTSKSHDDMTNDGLAHSKLVYQDYCDQNKQQRERSQCISLLLTQPY